MTSVQQRKVWHSHVSRTPTGHVPILLNGIPAWRIAGGTSKDVFDHFRAVAPRKAWPDWVKRMEAA